MTTFASHNLKVKVKTWSRDSYGLYDYETTSLTVQRFNLNGPSNLSRHDNEIVQGDPQIMLSQNIKTEVPGNHRQEPQLLASISETAAGIRVTPNNHGREGSDEDFWYIVKRGGDSEGYKLQTNDIIRLGRVRFRINQIKVLRDTEASGVPEVQQKAIMESIKEHMQKDKDNGTEALGGDRKMSSSVLTCRICLMENEEPDDPLISVCHCTGSVKYMHLKCIQNWVKSKLNMQQNKNIVTIYWKNLYCEICKQKLPINIMHKGEELSLIPIENKISGSYVVIESFSKEKDSTGIHLVDLSSNQDFRMGRGHDCDLKIPDISVSRVHALLVVSRGNLYLKDNMSKFGTLVLHKGPIVLNSDTQKSPWLQCGRTILKFSIKKPWFTYLPCGIGSLFSNSKIASLFGEDKRNREERATTLTQEGEDLRRNNTSEL